MAEAPRDQNHITAMLFESSTTPGLTIPAMGDQSTGRLFTDSASGSGTVTSVSVVTANGFAGTVATATTTPAITLTTSVTGILSGNGTAISAASTTGTGAVVLANTPTLITPALGAATATSIVVSGSATVGNGSTNYLVLAGSATNPTISVNGTGNADLMVTPLGNGQVIFGGGGWTYTTAASGKDSILFNSGAADAPNLKFAYANNSNFGMDTANSGAFGPLASQFLRFIKNSDETGGQVVGGWDASGNFAMLNNGYFGGTLQSVGHVTFEGVTSTGATGTGALVFATSPTLVTPTLGAATATSVNGLTISATTGTLNVASGKTLKVDNTLELAGTDSTVMTFPATTATIARTDAAQTFTGTQTFAQTILTANAITATSNAATIPVTSGRNIVTNSSAATLTITLTTASAVNMQTCMLQILDFSAVAQTLTFVNTENSTVSVPTTSNGSTTLPLTVGFVYNSATSKWRCIASA